MADVIMVITTTSNKEEAKKIAKILLEEKLAACIQIDKIESIYKWNGDIVEEEEFRVVIKTLKSLYKKVEEKIKLIHSYEIPQIIAIEAEALKEYKDWLKGELWNLE